MTIDSKFYMRLAIDEAWKYQLLTYPNPAVGAVVVKNGQLLSIEAHKEAGKPHAEVLALKEAYLSKIDDTYLKSLEESFEIHNYLLRNHNGFFNDCEIYVTLEPCNHIGKTPSCANLIKELKLKKVYVGLNDPNSEAGGGIQTLLNSSVEVELGILERECQDLLYPFIKWNEKNFVFFKMAQTLNGTVSGGYISSEKSLEFVHKIRDKLDLLVIGGNSVRVDRPTLDSRFCNGKSPNILIYSKKDKNSFDKEINLFKVKDRDVNVSSDIDLYLGRNKFIMIEGVYTLLEKLYNKFDLVVVILSTKIRGGLNTLMKDEIRFKIIYFTKIDEDIIFWLKIL